VVVDRNPNRNWRRPVAVAMGLIVVIAMIALSVLLYATPAKQHLGM